MSGIWNSEFHRLTGTQPVLNSLSTQGVLPYLNPVGWPALLVGSLHESLYVLYSLVNSATDPFKSSTRTRLTVIIIYFTRILLRRCSERSRQWQTSIYTTVNTRMWIAPQWAQPQRLMKEATQFVVLEERKFSEYFLRHHCVRNFIVRIKFVSHNGNY